MQILVGLPRIGVGEGRSWLVRREGRPRNRFRSGHDGGWFGRGSNHRLG